MPLFVDINKKLGSFNLNVRFETTGKMLGILGKSGCGKSMTLKSIAGVEKPDSGKIILNDKVLFDSENPINLLPQKRNVGYLFQNYALFPSMTVEQNIAVTMKGSKDYKSKKVFAQMERFGLIGLEKHYPSQLSGGQAQRVALARMLVSEPSIILLDEPFSALDTALKEHLQQDLFETLDDYGGDVIMVTHDRDEVYKFCPDLMVMDDGNTIVTGETRGIFKKPGYIEVAQITGCKNISTVRRIDDHHLEALDWNIELCTNESICDTIRYVGIRAMDIEVSDNGDGVNSIPVRMMDSMQTQFDIMIYCESRKRPGSLISRRIPKYSDDYLPPKEPAYYRMPPDHLLLLR